MPRSRSTPAIRTLGVPWSLAPRAHGPRPATESTPGARRSLLPLSRGSSSSTSSTPSQRSPTRRSAT
eukprot:10783724-Alexandrium_andersonii.AAC.1